MEPKGKNKNKQKSCDLPHKKSGKKKFFSIMPSSGRHCSGQDGNSPHWEKENGVSDQFLQLSGALHKEPDSVHHTQRPAETSRDWWGQERKAGVTSIRHVVEWPWFPMAYSSEDHNSLCCWGSQQPLSMLWTPTAYITDDPVVEPSILLCRGSQQLLPLRKPMASIAAADFLKISPLRSPQVFVFTDSRWLSLSPPHLPELF